MVTLVLHLQPLGNEEIALRATLLRPHDPARVVTAVLCLPTDEASATLDQAKNHGRLLGGVLFEGEPGHLFRDGLRLAAREAGTPLVCVLDLAQARALAHLQWAWLQAPFDNGWDFLAVNRRVDFGLQHQGNSTRSYPDIGPHNARALVLLAPPAPDAGTEPFDAAGMLADLCAALADYELSILAPASVVPPVFRAAHRGPPTIAALERLVAENQPAVLHVVAHGECAGRPPTHVLRLHDAAGCDAPVTSDAFQRALACRTPPRLIFLGACYSGFHAANRRQVYPHFGQVLIEKLGTPCVIAMNDRLETGLAKALFSGFYRNLANHHGVGLALGDALADLKEHAGVQDLLVPTVFSRLAGKPLFVSGLEKPLTRAEERRGNARLHDLILNHAPGCDAFLEPLARLQHLLEVADDAVLSADAQAACDVLRGRRDALCAASLDLQFKSLCLNKRPPVFPDTLPFAEPGVSDAAQVPHNDPDRRALADLLDEGGPVVLHGPQGAGKTRLALAALADCGLPFRRLTGSAPGPWRRNPEDAWLLLEPFDEHLEEPGGHDAVNRLLAEDPRCLLVCQTRHAARFVAPVRRYAVQAPTAETVAGWVGYQAMMRGYRLEPDLTTRIGRDLAACQRPLFWGQQLLIALWHRRAGRNLIVAAYVEMGGLAGVVHTAEQRFRRDLLGPENQPFYDNILRRLTYRDAATTPLCRLIPAPPFTATGRDMMQRVAHAGFLAVTHDGEKPVATAAHPILEAPFREAAEPEQPRTLQRQAESWDTLGRRDQDLPEREDWETREAAYGAAGYLLNSTEQAFLGAARRKQRDHLNAHRGRVARLSLLTGLLAVLAGLLAVALIGNRRLHGEAVAQTRLAETRLAASQALLAENDNDQGRHLEALAHCKKGKEALVRVGPEENHADLERETYRALVQRNSIAQWAVGRSAIRGILPRGNDHLVLIRERDVVLWNHRGKEREITYETNHANDLWVLADDGARLATASRAGSVALFSLDRHAQPHFHSRHTGEVTTLFFEPTTGALLSLGKDGRRVHWAPPAKPRVRRASFGLLAVQPDAQQPEQLIVDGQNGFLARILVAGDGLGEPIASAWPAGSRLFQTAPDHLVVRHGRTVQRFTDRHRHRYQPPFSIQQVASAGSGVAWIGLGRAGWLWADNHSQNHHLVDLAGEAAWRRAAVSPDGRLVAVADDLGRVVVAHGRSGFPLAQWAPDPELIAHAPVVRALAFNPQGNTLWLGLDSGVLAAWSIPEHRQPLHLQHGTEKTLPLTVDPLGQRVLTQSRSGVSLWDLPAGRVVQRFDAPDEVVNRGVFSRDGRILVLGTGQGATLFVDADSGTVRQRFPVAAPNAETGLTATAWAGKEVTALAVNETGTFAVAGDADGCVSLFDLSQTRVVASQRGNFGVTTAAVGGENAVLLGFADGVVWLLRDGGETRVSLPDHHPPLKYAAFCDKQRRWATHDNHFVYLWDAAGQPHQKIKIEVPLSHLMFADGRLVTAHEGGDLQWFDADGNRGHLLYPDKPAAVSALVVHGPWLFSAHRGQARLWDLRRDQVVALIESNDAYLGALAIREVDRQLLTFGMHSGLRRWPFDPVTPFFQTLGNKEVRP
ncbi:CHAT domain-containing protein [Acanthopleuribacter pedis]|uniref:CHAT domain-containing protein n=1 Tax=Acanthopleuribacter pedis TaxID=442870 RepID=A0A8J7QES8_9BACT|nr:CHAT domain-containing protein [Acanthopleuribacter pedis]MBO1319466.1 CHAT domain-containing protein [Acanthopleuribacter pedis]